MDRQTEELPAFSLRSLAATLRRQWLWMVLTTTVGIALTVVMTKRQRPVFEARATIRMAERQSAVPSTDVLAALSAPSTIETEMEILRSRTVAEVVVDSLGLEASVVEPKGAPRGELFGKLRVTRDAAPGEYLIQRDTTAFSVTAPDGHVAGGSYGAPLVAAGLEIEPLPPGPDGPWRIALAVRPVSIAAEALRQGLRISRPQANAGVVSVAYQSTDPALAADVVNRVARSYIARRTETQKQQYRAAVVFLESQVTVIGADLAQAESALEQFRRARVVIDPQAQAGDQVRRLADLRVQREELDEQRNALWDLVRRSQQPAESAADWTAFVASPVLLGNPAISSVLGQLLMLESERARLMTRRTARDPDVAGLLSNIGLLRGRLATLARATLQGLDDQVRSLDRTRAQSDAQLARVPEVQLQYTRLRRQVDLNSELYTLLQTRLKEAQISEASEIANVELVDPALPPTRPLAARRLFNLLFGSALALLCGVMVAVIRESNDTSVRSREEVVRITEVPLLATIPRIATANGRRTGLAEQIEGRLVIRHSPRSPAAEAYRALRTNVAFATNGAQRHLRTIVVTSPEPMDGKTTTAANLAITLAEQGLRVVLVEADQRRPVLHRVLHAERSPGLSDLLSGTAPLERAIRTIPLPHHAGGTFAFIPAGHTVPNPAELLGSAAMRELLVTLGERYDEVLLDTPPLCVVTDAAVLGTQADGVLLVARMGATHSETLRQSVEEMRGLGARVVGTVLTDVTQREDRYGYRYSYYHQYYEDETNGGKGKSGGKRGK